MPGIDDKRPFVPLKIAVLTVSDTRELADDKSGSTLAERIEKAGHAVAGRAIVTDDVEKIREQMRAWIADKGYDPAYVARPLKRVIQKYVQDPLAQQILAGNFREGDQILVEADEAGKLLFQRAEEPVAV